MKKKHCIWRVLLIALLIGCLLVPVSAEDTDTSAVADLSVTGGSHSMDAANPVLGSDRKVKNMESAIVYEIETDTLMYAFNPDAKAYPSSLVKILTALIAVEEGNLNDVVSVKKTVIDTIPYDAVSAELQEDEVITLRDLLYCMLVDSANDAAAVIADYVGGNQEAFVRKMNQYAAELGCKGTQFVNVHGLHHENQYTTARDMGKILARAAKNEKFMEIFSTITYTVPATNKSKERELSSGNFMMNTVDGMEIYYDERVTGGRTGTTEAGKRCFATTAQSGNLKVITVLMGAKSEYEEDGYTVRSFGGFSETKKLLDLCFTGYKPAQVLFDGQVLTQYPVLDGQNAVSAGVRLSAATVLPEKAKLSDLSFRYADEVQLTAPITAGQKLSDVQVWYKNTCVAQAELFALNDVKPVNTGIVAVTAEDTTAVWRNVGIVAGIILGVVAAAVILLFSIRFVRLSLARKRSKQYRRSRRRSR